MGERRYWKHIETVDCENEKGVYVPVLIYQEFIETVPGETLPGLKRAQLMNGDRLNRRGEGFETVGTEGDPFFPLIKFRRRVR